MVSWKRALVAIAVISLALAAAWGKDADSVTVQRMPATISSHTYDPDNPPAQMPATEPDEAGVTVSDYSCIAEVGGQIGDQMPRDKDVLARVQIDSIHITLRLTIAEWVAKPGPRKIWAHEDGHRMISLHFYMNAGDVAKGIAHEMIGQSVVGSGPDADTAAKNALTQAAQQIDHEYMIQVRDLSERVQEAYDRITAHGTNTIDESDAIDAALQETASEDKNAKANNPGI